jgi:hypothetical protein
VGGRLGGYHVVIYFGRILLGYAEPQTAAEEATGDRAEYQWRPWPLLWRSAGLAPFYGPGDSGGGGCSSSQSPFHSYGGFSGD